MRRQSRSINFAVAACTAGSCLFSPLLGGCATQTSRSQDSAPSFDEVLWTNPKASAPTRLYVTMSRSFEPDFNDGPGGPDNTDDLNNHVMRYAQTALQQAKSHGGDDIKIVFFVRSQPGWKVGYATELTLKELEQIAAAPRNEARKLLYPHQWLIIHLPDNLQPSATASVTQHDTDGRSLHASAAP